MTDFDGFVVNQDEDKSAPPKYYEHLKKSLMLTTALSLRAAVSKTNSTVNNAHLSDFIF